MASGRQFQSSPARRGGCNVLKRKPVNWTMNVSIITRSEERVQPRGRRSWARACTRFNPHPLRGAGATRAEQRFKRAFDVSILTRSEERVQLLVARRARRAQ